MVVALALVMKAPVWYVVARFDLIGGHGWDRAYLIDQFVHHISDWWLLGAKDNANWGSDTWDACNQFVAEGLYGGLSTFILFIVILKRGFSMIGRARRAAEGDRQQEWLFWCLGAALFSNVVAFWGIDYFDQTRLWWSAFLAMISVATVSGLATETAPEPEVAPVTLKRDGQDYGPYALPGSPVGRLRLKDARQSKA